MPTWFIITACILIFATIMFLMEVARSRYVLEVKRKTLAVDTLPDAFDGVKIVLVSDLHQMEFGEYNTLLARKIKLEEPDYIFFAGDMGDSESYDVDAFYDLLEALGNDVPLIMVPGNHDLRLGGGRVHKNFVSEVQSAGAVILDNARAELALGDDKIYIYGFCPPLKKQEGVDIKYWNFAQVGDGDIEKRLGKCPEDAPVILLAHDPTHFLKYQKWGATLVLSGHMHGGLVRLPFIGGLFGPEFRVVPKYTAGEYKINKSTMFVTRGLGNDHFFRFGNAPEIVVLTLSNVESQIYKKSLEKPKSQFAMITDWFSSEWHSIGELLKERGDQLRDFFDRKKGVKKSRFAQAADAKKEANTYLAPKNRAKQNARKIKQGASRVVSDREYAADRKAARSPAAYRTSGERRAAQKPRARINVGEERRNPPRNK